LLRETDIDVSHMQSPSAMFVMEQFSGGHRRVQAAHAILPPISHASEETFVTRLIQINADVAVLCQP
jgi:hypothetical protein